MYLFFNYSQSGQQSDIENCSKKQNRRQSKKRKRGSQKMGRHGENIHKRKDGRWEARLLLYHQDNGKPKYAYIYGKTYTEAKAKRNAMLKKRDTPLHEETLSNRYPTRIIFGQVIDEWFLAREESIKESSLVNYSFLIENHIRPEFGNVPLVDVTTEKLELFLKRKLQSGCLDGNGSLSAKTVSDIRSVLKMILSYARQKNYPVSAESKIKGPRLPGSHIRVLSKTEQRQLEQVLFEEQLPIHLGILLALYGGLRIGEVCALRWEDINFTNGTLRVNKTLQRIQNLSSDERDKTKVLITPPKTDSSNREIPLPEFFLLYLKEHRQDGNKYLLTGTTQPSEPRCCLYQYKRILKKAGLEQFTFHTLRHTFATRCVENGFDIKSLSEILGHSSVNTTLQRYVHPSFESKKAQMDKLAVFSIHGQQE